MKLAKFCVATLVGASVMCAFADAANTLISFSTKAPDASCKGDTYADGTVVKDGEWYALVWSADGVFEGVTTDCKAVDPEDAVVLVAPLAKGGHCPFTVFQIDSKSVNAKKSGQYAVYMLDTRSADGKTVAAKNADGLPTLLNGAVAAASYAAAAATDGGASQVSGSGSAVWSASVVKDVRKPKITAFKIDGDKVKISVSDIMPGVKYNVRIGASVDKLENYALPVPQMANDGVTEFNIDKAKGRFFQVVREPLKK